MTQVANAPKRRTRKSATLIYPKETNLYVRVALTSGSEEGRETSLETSPWTLGEPACSDVDRIAQTLYRAFGRRPPSVGWGGGESWFGLDAVLWRARPLVHSAVRVWRFWPPTCNSIQTILGLWHHIFSPPSFGETPPLALDPRCVSRIITIRTTMN